MGWFPGLALAAAVGVLICSAANALSRAAVTSSAWLYLLGLVVIAAPIFYRLSERRTPAGERLALVCLLGLAVYAVKVMREPFLFTLPDEFLHAYNAHQVDVHDHLFKPNPILPVSAYYPGLEGATSALMDMSGMSSLAAGTIVVGAARLALSIGLFCLFARVSGSNWLAGMGAAAYAGNPNFLIFGAQYSYESLALPLVVVIVWTLAERDMAPPGGMRMWSVPAVLLTAAVVVTHHATSFSLVLLLFALAIAYAFVGLGWRAPNPLPFAILTLALIAAWLFIVAGTALGYLGEIFDAALNATLDTLTGNAAFREPFQSTGPSVAGTPTPGRIVAALSALILLACLPFGLREIRRRMRDNPLALLFGAMAVAFFAALALRFASAAQSSIAWEVGNRASEFLYLGLAFVVALAFAVAYRWLRARIKAGAVRAVLTAIFAILVVGGAISGWPWHSQLDHPLRVEADGRTIESQPLGLARWAGKNLPRGKFVAPVGDAYPLLAPGGVRALGALFRLDVILRDAVITKRHLRYLRARNIRFVVADRRRVAEDFVRGYFFAVRPLPGRSARLIPRGPVRKWRHIRTAGRIFDDGDIVVYDLKARR